MKLKSPQFLLISPLFAQRIRKLRRTVHQNKGRRRQSGSRATDYKWLHAQAVLFHRFQFSAICPGICSGFESIGMNEAGWVVTLTSNWKGGIAKLTGCSGEKHVSSGIYGSETVKWQLDTRGSSYWPIYSMTENLIWIASLRPVVQGLIAYKFENLKRKNWKLPVHTGSLCLSTDTSS